MVLFSLFPEQESDEERDRDTKAGAGGIRGLERLELVPDASLDVCLGGSNMRLTVGVRRQAGRWRGRR